MKVNKIIREIMDKNGIKPTVLASRLGIKKNTMSERLSQENISTDRMIEMLRVMDYKIVVMPAECRLPNGAYEIDHSDLKVKENKPADSAQE